MRAVALETSLAIACRDRGVRNTEVEDQTLNKMWGPTREFTSTTSRIFMCTVRVVPSFSLLMKMKRAIYLNATD